MNGWIFVLPRCKQADPSPPSGGVEHFARVPIYRLKNENKTHTHRKKKKAKCLSLSLLHTVQGRRRRRRKHRGLFSASYWPSRCSSTSPLDPGWKSEIQPVAQLTSRSRSSWKCVVNMQVFSGLLVAYLWVEESIWFFQSKCSLSVGILKNKNLFWRFVSRPDVGICMKITPYTKALMSSLALYSSP